MPLKDRQRKFQVVAEAVIKSQRNERPFCFLGLLICQSFVDFI
jgi:hypothetical protein